MCRGEDHGGVAGGRSRQVGLTEQGGAAAGGRSRQVGLLEQGEGTRTVVVGCSSRQATGC